MPVKIVRADGSMEELKPNALKKALQNAGEHVDISDYYEKQLENEVTDKLLKDLRGTKQVNAQELREKLIAELETVERAAAELAKGIRNLDEEEFI